MSTPLLKSPKPIREHYQISETHHLRTHTLTDRMYHRPDGWTAMPLTLLEKGVRLPLHTFIITLLGFMGIGLDQMVPNSYIHIIAFIAFCHEIGVPPSIDFFFSLFIIGNSREQSFKVLSKQSPKSNSKFDKRPLMDTPSSNKGWHKDWFFVMGPKIPKIPDWISHKRSSLDFGNISDERVMEMAKLHEKLPLKEWSFGLLRKQAWLYDHKQLEQKTGPYTIWLAFHGLLANFQISTSTEARYFASIVPLVNCLRLLIHGLSLAPDEALIKSVTREGNPEELLKGPLYYVLILILCAVTFWRESPVGVVSLAMMCGGDGVADIMGRRFGSSKLPYNKQKSWAGSISMFVVGFLISTGMLYYFSALGYFELDWVWTMERVALVALVATVVESLPTTGVVDDNISVPLASMMTAFLSFGY